MAKLVLCLLVVVPMLLQQLPTPYVLAQEPSSQPQVYADVKTLTPVQAKDALISAQSELKTLPADAAEGSLEAEQKAILQRRIALLEEWISLAAKSDTLKEQKKGLTSRLQQAKAQLTRLEQQKVPQEPVSASKQDFETLTLTVGAKRDQVAAMRDALSNRQQWLEQVPQLIATARDRVDVAEKRISQIAAKTTAVTDGEAKKRLDLRLDNAHLDKSVALKSIEIMQAEAGMERELEPVRSAELALAEKQLERLELAYALYSKALEQQLTTEQQRQEAELVRKQEEVVAAETPVERFIAKWEANLSQSQKNKSDLETFLVGLKRDVAEQEKRLAAEKEELVGFREFLKRAGISGKTADRLKTAMRQLKMRRRLLSRPIRASFPQTLNAYRERRFEIEDTLFAINERWQEERNAIVTQLPVAEQAAFEARTASLLAPYRSALRDEKSLLTEAITLGQHAQILSIERMDNLNELEHFIRTQAFWLRDGKPLGIAVIRPIGKEVGKLVAWTQQLVSEEMINRLFNLVRRPVSVVYALLFFIALPAFLLYLRQRLRRVTQHRNILSLKQTGTLRTRLLTMLTGTLSPLLLPVYILITAALIAASNLPLAVRPVLVQVLQVSAYFLFFWFVTRNFFAERGIMQAQYGMTLEAANALYIPIRWLLLSYVTFFLLAQVLSRPPFDLESLPRLSYTLFEIIAGVVIIRLIRPSSRFVQQYLTVNATHFIARHWALISNLLTLLVVLIITLDVTGYRYAAQRLTLSFTLSLLTLIILQLLFSGTMATIQAVARRRRHEVVTVAPGEEPELTERVEQQVQRFVRVVFILLTIILLANYWGIDQQAFKALRDIHIYSIRAGADGQEFVTAADLLRAVLFLVITFWLLRGLPGIYEFAILPRLRLDEGMKYAVLTLARYGVFTVGILLTLSEVHLDLGRLGWLMAAIGVGLGFGLQEIVSNFVSGIILLVERPIQVNDVVTVGGMSGTVRRINIRATTIVNFDRQEVLLPNRSLITSEVTNWTRGDTILRLVISIGVAYGSDVDEVSALLLRIAQDQPEVLEDPAPSVVFLQHGESSLDFQLRVFIPSPSARIGVTDRINKAINKTFAERGISIPFPQRDLHIKSSAINFAGLSQDGVAEDATKTERSTTSD